MVSVTSIFNQSLAQAGARSTVANPQEDSNEAIQCNLFYEDTRDEILAKAFWNFARKTATLGLLKSAPGTPENPTGADVWSSDYPAPPWLYEYAYPSDCLHMRYVVPQIGTGVIGTPLTSNLVTMPPYSWGPPVRFDIATDSINGSQANVILTNQEDAIACYTMRITNTLLFSQLFTDALVFALAAKIVYPLTGERGRTNDLYQMANEAIVQARATEGNEGLEVNDPIPDWIRIRTSDAYPQGYGFWTNPYSPLYPVFAGS